MAITINTKLDVISKGIGPVIHLNQYDSDFTLTFNLYASQGTFTLPSGTTAEIRGTKADGNGYDSAASVSGTVVTVTGDAQMTAAAGDNVFEIALYKSNKRLNTINFTIHVEHAALDADTITSESVLRELDDIIEGAETATEAAATAVAAAAEATSAVTGKANASSVAPAFDNSTAYSGGDYVMKDGQLYQARSDIAAGDWDSTKWVSSYMANKIKQLRNIDVESIHAATEAIGGHPYGVFAYGYHPTVAPGNVVDFTPTPSTVYQTAVIAASGGDHFRVSLSAGSGNYQMWMWLDDSRQVIIRAGMTNMAFTGEIVAPTGAAWLVVNSKQEYSGAYAYRLTGEESSAVELAETVEYAKIRGSYWNAETDTAVLTAYSSYYAVEHKAYPGEIYHIRMYNATSAKQSPILFTDDDYRIINRVQGNVGNTLETRVTVPEGATKMLLTYTTYEISIFERINRYAINAPIDLRGKKVAIIGDSISTNGNYNPESNPYGNMPEVAVTEADVGETLSAYVTTNDVGNSIGGHTITEAEVGTEITFVPTAEDVTNHACVGVATNYNPAARVTWWEVMQQALGFEPIPVCWSGSSLSSHEEDKAAYKTAHAWHPAQIRKCGKRKPGTMEREAPDIIFIYRGTNDFSHKDSANNYNVLSDYFDHSNYPMKYPDTDYVDGHFDTMRGLLITIQRLREAYPDAMIFLCTLNVFKRVVYSDWPTRNTVNTLPEYCDAIRKAADMTGCGLIEFDKDGITFENCYSSGYITDSSDKPTHPNDKGHMMMAIRALQDFIRQYSAIIGTQV